MAEQQIIEKPDESMAELYEAVVIQNDLSKMSPEQRVVYYKQLCKKSGLNDLTKPFEYLNLNGKLTLYATKNCTDQLRTIHTISIDISKVEVVGPNLLVWAKATLPSGRYDTDCGSVKTGTDPNIIMKCTTKAKRRVTLSICGLGGILDESELDTIPRSRAQPIHNFKYCPKCQSKTYNIEMDICEGCHLTWDEIKEAMAMKASLEKAI